MSEGNWSAIRTVLLALAAGYAGDNASLHSSLTDAVTDIYVAGPALVSLVTMAIGIWKNHNTKKVPVNSVAIAHDGPAVSIGQFITGVGGKVVGCFALFAFLVFGAVQNAGAADLPVKATPIPYVSNNTCLTAGSCTGAYFTFGAGMDGALGTTLTGGGADGDSINLGAGYQLWKGQILAGVEVVGGYQFGTNGAVGTGVSTQFVKLGYNFFPSTATASPTASQNPFLNLVPANLLANSTPAFIVGGAYGHGIEKGAIGVEVDTVLAANWSAAFQLYNAPSVKGSPDETVFRVMTQYHFSVPGL